MNIQRDEDFEKAYSEICKPIIARPYPRNEKGEYVYQEIHEAYLIWQAAKSVPEGFVLMPKEPTDEIIEAMNEFDYRYDYSDMDGAYRTIVETLEKAQEDAELNAICDSRKDQKRISVNIDDL
jgi:hypothetical protein